MVLYMGRLEGQGRVLSRFSHITALRALPPGYAQPVRLRGRQVGGLADRQARLAGGQVDRQFSRQAATGSLPVYENL